MSPKRSTGEPLSQSSKLLPSLFAQSEKDQRLNVFHAGAALPETVDFFSQYRCKLHFVDIFSELPCLASEDEREPWPRFKEILHFPVGTKFDICLFWDLFNFLDSAAITAFLRQLQPYLHNCSRAHGFSVHNLKTPQNNQLYGIRDVDTLNLRHRTASLPGYAPHSQNQLKGLLNCFRVERSVLLPDSRLELLLRANLTVSPEP